MNISHTEQSSAVWHLCLMVLFTAAIIILPDLSFAQGENTPIGDVLCDVAAWFTGNTGRGIATLAIIVIGVGALMGKVSWGMAIIVGIGVAIIFGANEIVDLLDGSGTGGCDTTAGSTRV